MRAVGAARAEAPAPGQTVTGRIAGGSVKLAHVRKAITKTLPSVRIVEGDIFGAVGKGLTIEALRRYGPRA